MSCHSQGFKKVVTNDFNLKNTWIYSLAMVTLDNNSIFITNTNRLLSNFRIAKNDSMKP